MGDERCLVCGSEFIQCVSAYDSPCSWCSHCGMTKGEEWEEPTTSDAWDDLVKLRAAARALVNIINPNPDESHNPAGISGLALALKAVLDGAAGQTSATSATEGKPSPVREDEDSIASTAQTSSPGDAPKTGALSSELFTPEMVEAIWSISFGRIGAYAELDPLFGHFGVFEGNTPIADGLTREAAIRRAFDLSRGDGGK